MEQALQTPRIEMLCSFMMNQFFFASSNIFLQIPWDSKLITPRHFSHFICSWWWSESLSSYTSQRSERGTRRKAPISRKRLMVRNTLALQISGKFSLISCAENMCFDLMNENIFFLSLVRLLPCFLSISVISIIETWYQIINGYYVKLIRSQ